MSQDTEILEKMQLYSKGDMSLDEQLAFESMLEENPALKNRLQASMIVDHIVIATEALKLKKQMRTDLYPAQTPWRTYLAIGLTALLLSGVLVFILNKETERKEIVIKSDIKIEEPTPAIINTQPKPNQKLYVNIAKKVTEKPSKEAYNSTKTFNISVNPAIPLEESFETIRGVAKSKDEFLSSGKLKPELSNSQTTDPCNSLQPDFEFYTVPSCKGKNTGEIHIKPESIKGGTSPFTFSIEGTSSIASFENIATGSYKISIKDANDCQVTGNRDIVVSSISCTVNKDYSFNPDLDQAWTIPYNHEKVVSSFKVIDKTSQLYYHYKNQGSAITEWKGESNTGQGQGIGLYFYTIEYTDGSVEDGTITISR